MAINNKKYYFFSLIIMFMLAYYSCTTSKTEDGLYCINCKSENPDSELISIKLTIDDASIGVPLTIYNNKFNPSNSLDIVYDTIVNITSFTIKVATNKYYSIKATYKSGNKTIHAIDGGWFDTQKLTGCQNTCWQTVGGSYDLRLKN
jgi:hypothetical protein